MTPCRLSILMPAMADRNWVSLADKLHTQAAACKGVEFLLDVDSGKVTSGIKRQRLAESARGDYIAFVDDDDDVSDDYAASLLSRLTYKPDVVTFDLEQTTNGVPKNTQSFGLSHTEGTRTSDGMQLMQANHLCAWRRDLALSVAWDPRLGYADDQIWYRPLLGSIETAKESHIPRVLYRYDFQATGTANQTSPRVALSRALYRGGAKCWRLDDGEIVIATLGTSVLRGCKLAPVRDRHNVVRVMSTAELGNPFVTANIV